MIWVLLFLLIVLDIGYFLFFDKNILSPSVLAVSMFVLSTFVACLNVDTWAITISAYTVFMILSSLITLGLGEFIAGKVFQNKLKKIQVCVPKAPIEVPAILVVVVSILLGVLCIHYLEQLMKLAVAAGYKKDQGMLFVSYVRIATLDSAKYGRIDRLAGWSNTISNVCAYIFLYIICYNFVFFKKIKVKYFIPVLIYLPYVIFSGGRTQFIYITAFYVIVGGTFYLQKTEWSLKSVLRVVGVGIIGFVVFLLVFILVGALKNRAFITKTLMKISIYIGQSIPALNDYFLNPRPAGEYFGQHVLFGIYNFLREFNPAIPDFYAPYEFVSFNGYGGNVYTAIRRYHQDFGFIGLYGMMLFLGFFYGGFYSFVKKGQSFGLILYAYIIGPIVLISIDEIFFLSIVSHGSLARYILLYCGFLFFCDPKIKNKMADLLHFCKKR